jgi:hypothetical protein
MNYPIAVQGRSLEAADISWINSLIDSNPNWNRTRISQHIATQWGWRNAAGQLKDMAARSMLGKLEQRGLITLPPRQYPPPYSKNPTRCIEPVLHATNPIEDPLAALRPLGLELVEQRSSRELFTYLLHTYHYLSYSRPVGENLPLLIWDRQERPLGCLLFGAAAWKVASRDRFIGWNATTRAQNLPLVANNMRFLILPWVRVPHLASHVLSRAARELSIGWQRKYGHPIHLLETFVERDRFRGTSYVAANWLKLGKTSGRGRNDRNHSYQSSPKDVFCYPLHRNFRRLLNGTTEGAKMASSGCHC